MKLNVQKISKLRKAAGLSQAEAARAAKFPGNAGKSRWSDIENGLVMNPKLETLNAIARALGVKATDLLM